MNQNRLTIELDLAMELGLPEAIVFAYIRSESYVAIDPSAIHAALPLSVGDLSQALVRLIALGAVSIQDSIPALGGAAGFVTDSKGLAALDLARTRVRSLSDYLDQSLGEKESHRVDHTQKDHSSFLQEVTANRSIEDHARACADARRAYESNIGGLTGHLVELIDAAVEEYGGVRVEKAILRAVEMNRRTWAYIDGILQRDRAQGGGSTGARPHQGEERVIEFPGGHTMTVRT